MDRLLGAGLLAPDGIVSPAQLVLGEDCYTSDDEWDAEGEAPSWLRHHDRNEAAGGGDEDDDAPAR